MGIENIEILKEEPEVVRMSGKYICEICGQKARDHPPSVQFPWPTFVTMCDGREAKT